MRRYCFIVVIVSLFVIFTSQVHAQSVDLKASVGKYYLSLSGFVSPFASVVLSSNSIFMASTVADSDGNFSFSNVLINEGFSDFCFEVVDVKRVGDSFTCLKIPPARGNTKREKIFLPPTVGLSARKINPGSSIFASGYSMRNAKVLLNISEGIILHTTADESGFYKIEIKNLAAGKYSLFATARYEKKDSEKPTKKHEIESLSSPKILLLILLILIIIILLLILLSKKMRDKIRSLLGRKAFSKKKVSHLHHDWFLGY